MRKVIRNIGLVAVLIAVLNYGVMATAQAQPAVSQTFREVFERSQKDNKGVMIYFRGQSIGGVVIKINTDSVELRNQQYGRIVIRLDSIDGVAGN